MQRRRSKLHSPEDQIAAAKQGSESSGLFCLLERSATSRDLGGGDSYDLHSIHGICWIFANHAI